MATRIGRLQPVTITLKQVDRQLSPPSSLPLESHSHGSKQLVFYPLQNSQIMTYLPSFIIKENYIYIYFFSMFPLN